MPCMVHGTTISKIPSILCLGLLPGGPNHERFMNRLAPYPPGDSRLVSGMRYNAESHIYFKSDSFWAKYGMHWLISRAGALLLLVRLEREDIDLIVWSNASSSAAETVSGALRSASLGSGASRPASRPGI